jgi:hypothetical protein
VLVSAATADVVADTLPAEVKLVDLGELHDGKRYVVVENETRTLAVYRVLPM